MTKRRFCLDLALVSASPPSGSLGGVEHCLFDYDCVHDAFPFHCWSWWPMGRGRWRHWDGRTASMPGSSTPTALASRIAFAAPAQASRPSISPSSMGRRCGGFELRMSNGCAGGTRPGRPAPTPWNRCCLPWPTDGAASKALDSFQRAKGLVARDILALWSLEDIAGRCHLAPAYTYRLFKRFERKTVHQHLLLAKMGHAAEHMQLERRLVPGWCSPKDTDPAKALTVMLQSQRELEETKSPSPGRRWSTSTP